MDREFRRVYRDYIPASTNYSLWGSQSVLFGEDPGALTEDYNNNYDDAIKELSR